MNHKFHITLSNYFQSKPLYLDEEEFKKPNVRKLVEQPWQELEAAKALEKKFKNDQKIKEEREQLWDNVTNTLCNLDFIQAKAAAKLTYDLVNEINSALKVIPDNAEEIVKEKARQARMEKYTQDLIACAKGEITIDELEIPESITPWTEEQINAEIERIKTTPNRADQLKVFLNFLGQEANNLQIYANEFSHFAIQQAWNYSKGGPVDEVSNKHKSENLPKFILRTPQSKQNWNPFPDILKILSGHTSNVESISITPNGKLAISASMNKACILWDLERGKPLKTLYGHTARVTAVAITPDGEKAISGSWDNTIILWNLKNGAIEQTLRGHTQSVLDVSITPDGKIAISCSEDKTCILWDLEKGILKKILKGHSASVNCVAMTPNGKYVVSGSTDNSCILWDLEKEVPLKILEGHSASVISFSRSVFLGLRSHSTRASVLCVAMTPNGKYAVSGASDNSCILWDLRIGEQIRTLKGHAGMVFGVDITPDGKRVVSVSEDHSCIVWNLTTGMPLRTLKGHTNCVYSIAITPDGIRAISGSGDNNLILWDIVKGYVSEQSYTHSDEIMAIEITADKEKAISTSRDGNGIVWNIEFGKPIHINHLCSEPWALANNPWKNQAIIGSLEGEIIYWDYIRNNIIKTLNGHSNWVNGLLISPDGQYLVSYSLDSDCILWELESGKLLKIFKGHTEPVKAIAFLPNGKFFMSGSSDNTCILWDLSNGMNILTLRGHTKEVTAVAISPDGKYALTGSDDNNCILWELRNGKPLRILNGHTSGIIALAITSDGKKAITSSLNSTFIIWDLISGLPIKIVSNRSGNVKRCYITDDNKHALLISSSCLLWDIESLKFITEFFPRQSIEGCCLRNEILVLGGYSGEIFFLNIPGLYSTAVSKISTIQKVWDHTSKVYLESRIYCPTCCNYFKAQPITLQTIEDIKKETRLNPEQSPCLELPQKYWDHPSLFVDCPNCDQKLKLNPFIAGGEEY